MITITEALQEVKTLIKRIEKKQEFIRGFLWRQNHLRDPHEKDGGSRDLIKKERQAIKDLENNIIDLRRGIATANAQNNITVCGETMSIADWIVWRREIATGRREFLKQLQSRIQNARLQALHNGVSVVDTDSKVSVSELIINIDEKELADELEKIVEIMSTLDGQLSLKNSTVKI